MTPLVALVVGALAGALVAATLAALVARRARAALVRRLSASVGPVLERRASALGLGGGAAPRVDVGRDGELELAGGDALDALVRLAEAIENHEHAQLGYLDTMRVSKDEVDARLGESTGERLKGGGR